MLINNGVINPALLELIRASGLVVVDESPQAINAMLQEKWKVCEGAQRAQIQGRFPNEGEMMLLRQLGTEEVPIDFDTKYDGTLLLGATLEVVVRRVRFMETEEDKGVGENIPEPLYLLGSRRALYHNQEMPEHVRAILEQTGARFNGLWKDFAAFGNWPQNEIMMMKCVVFWMGVSNWNHQLIPVPCVLKPDNSLRSANTAETIKEWLLYAPPGHYLVVSSQPSCEYQLMAVERAVKEACAEGYTFDVCGPEAPLLPLPRWLDNLAKQLWEEVQLLSK